MVEAFLTNLLLLKSLWGGIRDSWGHLGLCLTWDVGCILIGNKQEVVPVENPVFRLLPGIRSQAFDLIDRPVLQLRLNNETTIFPSVLYLLLAHKAIGTNHNNVSRL